MCMCVAWDLGAWCGVGVAVGPGGMAWCGCGRGTWGHGMVWVWPWDLGAWRGVGVAVEPGGMAWCGCGVGPGGMVWCGCGRGTWGRGVVWVAYGPIVGTKHKPADSSRLLWFPLLRTLLSSYITAFKLRDLIHV